MTAPVTVYCCNELGIFDKAVEIIRSIDDKHSRERSLQEICDNLVKSDKADLDTAAIIQIEKAAGLKYINGAVAVTAANGVLAITDEASGDITITLDEVETAKLSPGRYYYDVQVVRTAGTVSTLTEGVFNVSADVTRATT